MDGGYCPQCGAELPDEAKYCIECGTKVPTTPNVKSATRRVGSGSGEFTESDSGEASESEVLNITLGKIIAYPVGAILILVGLGALASSVFSALLLIAGGMFALPVVRSYLEQESAIVLSQWATVVIVVLFVIGGGMVLGASENTGTEPAGAEGVDDDDIELIETSSMDLVIQTEQLGAGWTQGKLDGNETHAESAHTHTGDGIHVISTVNRYDSVEEATEEYAERVEEIQERRGTDAVSVGDEGIVYSTGDSAWVLFRDSNVVAEVQYQEQHGYDVEGGAEDFAELMHDNF